MELWLSIVGFLVVIGIIVSIMTKKLSTMVALSVIPLIGAILVGQFTSIPAYLAAGISKVAVNGVMFVFAILFFGTMMTAGAFDPIVKFIIKCCRGNPLYVCIGTYVLSIVGHLDGSATTTVLLVCGAMIPIYQKMHMRLRNLAAILAMARGPDEHLSRAAPRSGRPSRYGGRSDRVLSAHAGADPHHHRRRPDPRGAAGPV